jgi:hypothetical protein
MRTFLESTYTVLCLTIVLLVFTLFGTISDSLYAEHLTEFDAEGVPGLVERNTTPTGLEAIFDDAIPLTATDGQFGELFGYSVAIDGDTAVIGASFADIGDSVNQGAVYVYTSNGTSWLQQQKLVADDGAEFDEFGYAVAIDGDTVVIGAARADIFISSDDLGAVYVFTRDDTTWTQQQKITVTDISYQANFGHAVAVDGNTLIAGAYRAEADNNPNQGAAYVYTRSGSAWSQEQKLTSSDGTAWDEFGQSVALQEDTALIGAVKANVGDLEQGAGYVFTRSGTIWTEQQKLVASDDAFGAIGVGKAVALDSDTAVLGANHASPDDNFYQGAATVFTFDGTIWNEQQKLVASDGAAFDEFGVSVALVGDTVAVGAFEADISGNAGQGAAYVFTRSGSVWSEQQKLIANDGSTDDHFGCAVALDHESAVIGAYGVDIEGNVDQGRALVFPKSATLLPQSITFPTPTDGYVGNSVTLMATASSGLSVTYASNTLDICTVTDDRAALIAVGACTLVASQAGDETYAAADDVAVTFAAIEPMTQLYLPVVLR